MGQESFYVGFPTPFLDSLSIVHLGLPEKGVGIVAKLLLDEKKWDCRGLHSTP